MSLWKRFFLNECAWYILHYLFIFGICDMIKGNESDVRNIDFELEAKKGEKLLCFTLFFELTNCSYLCNQMSGWDGVWIKMEFFEWTSHSYWKVKTEFCRHETHSPWSCHILCQWLIAYLTMSSNECTVQSAHIL